MIIHSEMMITSFLSYPFSNILRNLVTKLKQNIHIQLASFFSKNKGIDQAIKEQFGKISTNISHPVYSILFRIKMFGFQTENLSC